MLQIRKVYILLFSILMIFIFPLSGQKSYSVSGGEWIFSGSDVRSNGTRLNTNVRFTFFFHLEQELHYDFTDFLGFYSGIGIRNVGLILDDYYPPLAQNVKIKHRSYSLGIPAAIKLGSFKKNAFIYGGAEIEYLFHYKQKMYLNNTVWKYSEWNSRRVNRLNPSVFVGFQFPNGINLKAKWYLENFLNPEYRGFDFSNPVDYSMYDESRLFYLSLSFKLGSKNLDKLFPNEEKTYNASLL